MQDFLADYSFPSGTYSFLGGHGTALSWLPPLVIPSQSSLQAPPSLTPLNVRVAQSRIPGHPTLLTVPFSPFRHHPSTHGTHSPASSPDHMSRHLLSVPQRMPILWASQAALSMPFSNPSLDPLPSGLSPHSSSHLSPETLLSAYLTSSRHKGSAFWPLSPQSGCFSACSLQTPLFSFGPQPGCHLLQVPTQTVSPFFGSPSLSSVVCSAAPSTALELRLPPRRLGFKHGTHLTTV